MFQYNTKQQLKRGKIDKKIIKIHNNKIKCNLNKHTQVLRQTKRKF